MFEIFFGLDFSGALTSSGASAYLFRPLRLCFVAVTKNVNGAFERNNVDHTLAHRAV